MAWNSLSFYDHSVPVFWWLLPACAMSQSSNHPKVVSWTWQEGHCTHDLHSPQISAQQSIFGMWWNRRVTTLMCSWHICSNCLLLSNPRKSKSMDVSSTVKLELTNSSRALYCQKSWKNSAWHTHTKTFVIPVCCRASIYFYFKKMKQHKSNKKTEPKPKNIK